MPPEIVAHRGYARRYPENTLAALAGAVGAGARHLEVDVQLSRDRVPVLFHDRDLLRMCGAEGAVHDRSAAELAALPAAERGRFGERFAAEPIATLSGFAAFLAAQAGIRAFVEIKRVALERFGPEVVLERVLGDLEPVLDRCVLISFASDVLRHARGRTSLPVGPVIERWSDLREPRIAALGAEYVFADVAILPERGPLGLRGQALVVYEVDDPRFALELGARGVDMVETFAVGEMIAGLSALARDR